ncbi:hypothetical protein BDU57DRAFT_517347 [Ampelomyces quisqualis]|uniref:Uncharacterized protein n=1 Tax=Ampelomyces quisqualis TaxID=50730 RepID=A0A6A5QPY2_AMPQU|nr:hypothetical protein BDU57DRAFT_517347 [Ampelomyces quisqualis]
MWASARDVTVTVTTPLLCPDVLSGCLHCDTMRRRDQVQANTFHKRAAPTTTNYNLSCTYVGTRVTPLIAR